MKIDYVYKANRRTTKLTRLLVKGVPSGSTVTLACKRVKPCPPALRRQRGKKLVAKPFVVRRARGTIALTKPAKGAMKRTTVLTIAITKPGFVGMLKTVTLRLNKAPRVTTGCLAVTTNRPARC